MGPGKTLVDLSLFYFPTHLLQRNARATQHYCHEEWGNWAEGVDCNGHLKQDKTFTRYSHSTLALHHRDDTNDWVDVMLGFILAQLAILIAYGA